MIKLPKKIDYKKAKQFFKSIGLSFLNDLSLNEIKKKKTIDTISKHTNRKLLIYIEFISL